MGLFSDFSLRDIHYHYRDYVRDEGALVIPEMGIPE